MPRLLCFGLGYSAQAYVAAFGGRFDRITGTVRDPARAAALTRDGLGGRAVEALVFADRTAVPVLDAAIAEADALVVSIGPDAAGDPVLDVYAEAIGRAPRLEAIVYLSTVGVYGDHGGAWIDETAPTSPVSARSRERLAAERAWAAHGARAEKALAILRLAGIYGPGQNALVQLARGAAKRIVKPGQVFNRIHVADIAQAIEGALARRANGVFNVADDEPTPGQDVVAYAAELLGIAPPPEVAFADVEASMTPMALSFYGEVKRVMNARLKTELGVALSYPTYREGIRALWQAGEGRLS